MRLMESMNSLEWTFRLCWQKQKSFLGRGCRNTHAIDTHRLEPSAKLKGYSRHQSLASP